MNVLLQRTTYAHTFIRFTEMTWNVNLARDRSSDLNQLHIRAIVVCIFRVNSTHSSQNVIDSLVSRDLLQQIDFEADIQATGLCHT